MQQTPKRFPLLVILIPGLCLMALAFYYLPPVNDRLAWRVEAFRARIKYAINPPEQVVFVPQSQPSPVATHTPIPSFTPTLTLIPTLQPPGPTDTLVPSPTLTFTPTPLPTDAALTGIRHEYQSWNNCGPANLSMALSYWDWPGTQKDTAEFLKPNQRDKNVMPYEMAAYVEEQTDLIAIVREGGDLDLLKALVAGGFPVIVEKGFEGPGFEGWMGHYEVVNGYDDSTQRFFVQDSYKGPDLPVPYDELLNQWRAFNYLYILVYPADRQTDVESILGLQSYENFNQHHAEQKAAAEIQTFAGRDLFFVLFNQGTSLVNLRDYTAAATAFDAAFANYPSISEQERPWRLLWYQTGPYFAYYYTDRHQDVIDLATTTLNAMSEPILEESYYWRAKAQLALGEDDAAIEDLRQCLKVHPDFLPCVNELITLGLEP